MDLGGASTQITFETASPAEDPANEVQLRLYGQQYRVYTHSFLCYGRDQVLQRLLASALQVPQHPQPTHTTVPLEGGGKKGWGQGHRAEPGRQAARLRRASPCSRTKVGFNQLKGQVGRDPVWAKAQWLGVGLVSAKVGRKGDQGQISVSLECPASNAEPWIAPEHSSDVTKWDLWEIHQAGPLGRPS